jgi:hypothetical protein
MGCGHSRCHQVCAQSINHHVIIPAPPCAAPCAAPCGGLGYGLGGLGGYGGYGGLGYGGCGAGLGGYY